MIKPKKKRISNVNEPPCLTCGHLGRWRRLVSDQDIRAARCSALKRDVVMFDGLIYTDEVFKSPQYPIEQCDKWEMNV